MTKNTKSLIFRGLAYVLIFCAILTVLTLIFLPKRNCNESEAAQVAGFYKEPDNTLDVLYLGSCNMYSSVSPVLIYEQYGITGYAMCCPDEEMSTSYTYLQEALKHHDLKMVVVESLFLTEENNSKREYYNRYALDYLPPSLNKLKLAWDISRRESSFMKQYDATAPDTLLTFSSYLFPILRFHSRNDLVAEDVTKPFMSAQYNFYKGGFPQYTYNSNDGLFFDKVFNGNSINEMSRKYVPMIKQLCDEKGIPMIIVKSPNYARWGYDDSLTGVVRDFAAELEVPFIDFHNPEINTFKEWDYGYETGRLNVYGVKKFSEILGRYLTEEYGLKPTELSDQDRAAWDACVEKYRQVAEEKECSITEGRIAQICNQDGAIQLRWNPCEDSRTYSIYRCTGENGNYTLLTDQAEGELYLDQEVVSGRGYTYYVVPNEGRLSGKASQTAYYIYLDMPQNYSLVNNNGAMHLEWEKVNGANSYRIQRRMPNEFNFKLFAMADETTFDNKKVDSGTLYYYRLCARRKEGDKSYYSMSQILRCMPLKDPVISTVSSKEGKIVINWNKLKNQDEIQIYRRSEKEKDFKLVTTVEGTKTNYVDENVKDGLQYFYKIVSLKSSYGYDGVSEESNTVGVRAVE